MNEQHSRKLDLWVGVALCWLLTKVRRLRRCVRLGHHDPGPAVQKIVFVKLAEMGAIALAMPAFEAARRRVGRENVYLLMLDTNREIHELLRFFPPENLITIRDCNLWVFARDAWRALGRCRREDIDAAIDLEGFARISAILAFLSGARTRVGLDRYTSEGPYRGDLFTHRVALNYYQHASLQFLTLVAALDGAPDADVLVKEPIAADDYRLPRFEPSAEDRAELERLLTRRCGAAAGRPLVVFNANLIDLLPLRRWPKDHFVALGRRILAEGPETTILLTGLSAERTQSEALAREISPQRAFSLAGDTTIRTLATLFTVADLLVTSDSGPAHMAAFTDIPIVSLFGPETPQLYAPLSPHNVSLWAGLACSPCLNAFNHRRSACRDNVCLRSISVEQVYQAAKGVCPALGTPTAETSN